ncbi:MAG: hypothetical protein HY392_02335 [Candidatus Diapherotrites archaeon]|nr:hypothetical protein [Candidatus Diapherotrites archaeon]
MDKLMFYGIDHLSIASCQTGAESLANQWKKGSTLFIEGSSESIQPYSPNARGFYLLVQKAREVGMKIVFLDKPKFGDPWIEVRLRVKNPKKLAELRTRYFRNNLREGHWRKKIERIAKPGDIIVMHPNHLQNMHSRWPEFVKSFIFLSKPISVPPNRKPLTPNEIKKMRAFKAARRPANFRKRRI